eukprot:GHUV01034494.1.p1 GENE.GHUV01034494.1~~GHUV01034494.1.p1  ORF type:complete len:197 (+),score=44.92 GHUV01034494.1:718-1308(+)
MHRVQFWQCAVRHHAPLTHIPAPMPCREAPQHPLIQPLVGPAPLHHRPVHLSCLQVEHPRTKQLHRFWFDSPVVGLPINDAAPPGAETRLFPRDCREGGTTYRAPFTVDICYEAQHSPLGQQRFQKRLGYMPIMVKSSGCHLRGMNRQQLVAAKEESTEFGGYFICNGIERIIRMLILQVTKSSASNSTSTSTRVA